MVATSGVRRPQPAGPAVPAISRGFGRSPPCCCSAVPDASGPAPMNCERAGPRGDERLDHAAGVLGLRSGHAVDHQAFLLLEAAHRALGLRAVATVNGDVMTVGDQLLLQRLDVGAVGADVALAQIGHGSGSGGTGLRRSGLAGGAEAVLPPLRYLPQTGHGLDPRWDWSCWAAWVWTARL